MSDKPPSRVGVDLSGLDPGLPDVADPRYRRPRPATHPWKLRAGLGQARNGAQAAAYRRALTDWRAGRPVSPPEDR